MSSTHSKIGAIVIVVIVHFAVFFVFDLHRVPSPAEHRRDALQIEIVQSKTSDALAKPAVISSDNASSRRIKTSRSRKFPLVAASSNVATELLPVAQQPEVSEVLQIDKNTSSRKIFSSIESVTRSMAKNDAAKPWSGLNRPIDTSISNVIGKRLEQAIASESKRADGSIRVTTSMGTSYCLYPRKDGQPSNPVTCD